MNTGLRTWFDKAGPLGQSLAVLAVVVALLILGFAVWRGLRALRGKKAADVLTVVAAAMASSVAATGMWHFFSRTMHLPVWIQAVLFAFMEISVLASALRARANVARDGEAGADGLAVWVLTSASGLMSASEAASAQEALVRLGAPLVAAWLWERSMVPERRAQKAAKGTAEAAVRWLFSIKRVAVRLGLATALGADLETEDANRRIDRFVRADNRAQRAGRLTRARAAKRRDRAHARLMEQARMQADPRALYAHLGRQAILDVLARLGGDDAVIDRERARQMQHILADAAGTAGSAEPARPADDAPPAAPATPPPPAAAPEPTPAWQPAPQPAAARQAPLDPMVLQLPRQAVPVPAAEAEHLQYAQQAAAQPAPVQARAQQPQPVRQRAPRQNEAPQQQPAQAADAANSAPAGFRTASARHATHGPVPANGQPANSAPPVPRTLAATGNGAARAARAQIPVEPVRSVAAALPEPEPEPEPVYAYFEADPDPEYEPEPAVPEPQQPPQAPAQPQLRLQPTPPEQAVLPMPPAAVSAPMIDEQIAARITKAMAAARIPPNPIKLANELGISPALMKDTLDALGGFDSLWSRLRQDQDAEAPGTSVEFYTA